MLRVLHLCGCDADLESLRGMQTLLANDLLSSVQRIGRGGNHRTTLQTAVALRAPGSPGFDLIHAWDLPALRAALASSARVVFSVSTPMTGGPLLRWALARRKVEIVVSSRALASSMLAWGIVPQYCHVIAPAIGSIDLRKRDELREQLGLSRQDCAALGPGESTVPANHALALHAISILHVLDQRFRLLVWGRGPSVSRLRSLACKLRQEKVLIVAEEKLGNRIEFERLVCAADLALLTPAAHVSPVAALLCMAAGLPVIAAPSPMIGEFPCHGSGVALVSSPAPRLLAQKVLELSENPGASIFLGRGARDAVSRFSPENYLDRYKCLYNRRT